jgi:hypothetical protein
MAGTNKTESKGEDHGMQGIKIADKAMLAAQKMNLEGNSQKAVNFFAVLYNDELVSRSRKMGVNIDETKMEKLIF